MISKQQFKITMCHVRYNYGRDIRLNATAMPGWYGIWIEPTPGTVTYLKSHPDETFEAKKFMGEHGMEYMCHFSSNRDLSHLGFVSKKIYKAYCVRDTRCMLEECFRKKIHLVRETTEAAEILMYMKQSQTQEEKLLSINAACEA